ncbi:hypothetical protein LguiA_025905 [Lonicera macranthoides]
MTSKHDTLMRGREDVSTSSSDSVPLSKLRKRRTPLNEAQLKKATTKTAEEMVPNPKGKPTGSPKTVAQNSGRSPFVLIGTKSLFPRRKASDIWAIETVHHLHSAHSFLRTSSSFIQASNNEDTLPMMGECYYIYSPNDVSNECMWCNDHNHNSSSNA